MENPDSHRYVVVNGRSCFTALSTRHGYSFETEIQNEPRSSLPHFFSWKLELCLQQKNMLLFLPWSEVFSWFSREKISQRLASLAVNFGLIKWWSRSDFLSVRRDLVPQLKQTFEDQSAWEPSHLIVIEQLKIIRFYVLTKLGKTSGVDSIIFDVVDGFHTYIHYLL